MANNLLGNTPHQKTIMIPNHYSATLSDLDRQMVEPVPPGGNWKDIPRSVPSKRLQQIRESYAAGKGSRSTYYGRLRPELPSYTISTYFNRPGNGCFVHYDYEGQQHRMISQREAARLQSFPDDFEFHGSKTSINKQIGNAVPPILAYQLAQEIPFTGQFVDLFCGAGGLSLGFHWAGWQQVIANDIDPKFLETYRANHGGETVAGDICDPDVFNKIIVQANKTREENPDLPTIVLGGPPCQGFSTAGKRRSMKDDRNHLFKRYADVLAEINPEAFIFENVAGLKNMEGGTVLELISNTLSSVGYKITVHTVKSEQYGVPQRRTRVLLIGTRIGEEDIYLPSPITMMPQQKNLLEPLPVICGVMDALSDLPPISPGEDGSSLNYISAPRNDYQRFCRAEINVEEYLGRLREG